MGWGNRHKGLRHLCCLRESRSSISFSGGCFRCFFVLEVALLCLVRLIVLFCSFWSDIWSDWSVVSVAFLLGEGGRRWSDSVDCDVISCAGEGSWINDLMKGRWCYFFQGTGYVWCIRGLNCRSLHSAVCSIASSSASRLPSAELSFQVAHLYV